MKGWRAREGLFLLTLMTTAQCKTMGKSKYFSILQHNHQDQVFEYLNTPYI